MYKKQEFKLFVSRDNEIFRRVASPMPGFPAGGVILNLPHCDIKSSHATSPSLFPLKGVQLSLSGSPIHDQEHYPALVTGQWLIFLCKTNRTCTDIAHILVMLPLHDEYVMTVPMNETY